MCEMMNQPRGIVHADLVTTGFRIRKALTGRQAGRQERKQSAAPSQPASQPAE
ncbi:hypothetical protein A2U01_0056779 [Trifolium medium]|uniref:Uncharacterized protein n=1 Tax=Trifolium medium TaxID=97028 RepID=A0A392RG18_9FABA|nr:hypothetical protein [Trifolium medium]